MSKKSKKSKKLPTSRIARIKRTYETIEVRAQVPDGLVKRFGPVTGKVSAAIVQNTLNALAESERGAVVIMEPSESYLVMFSVLRLNVPELMPLAHRLAEHLAPAGHAHPYLMALGAASTVAMRETAGSIPMVIYRDGDFVATIGDRDVSFNAAVARFKEERGEEWDKLLSADIPKEAIDVARLRMFSDGITEAMAALWAVAPPVTEDDTDVTKIATE